MIPQLPDRDRRRVSDRVGKDGMVILNIMGKIGNLISYPSILGVKSDTNLSDKFY